MNIRSFPASLSAAATLLALALPAQTQAQVRPAYLEVVPLTIKWTRTTSAITRSRTTEVTTGTDPVAMITTDTVRPVVDLGPIGNYSDFLVQFGQNVGVFAPVDWNFQGNRNIITDLVAVRLPARSVEEFATNPYHIYFTATDRRTRTYPFAPALVDDAVETGSIPTPTGLTISLGEYFGRTTEVFDNQGRLFSATGTISTSFKVDYSSSFYPSFPSLTPRHMFLMTARGTAIYTIRTVKLNKDVGTPAFLAPAATTLRGIGYHAHDYFESANPITPNYTHLGLAPVSIVLGAAKYIAQERFPDFVLPNVPTDLAATADSDTQISIGWTDAADNESSFQVERRVGPSGPWSLIATLPEDSEDFVDDTVVANTTYFYRVRAGNRFGFSAYSAESNATTPAVP